MQHENSIHEHLLEERLTNYLRELIPDRLPILREMEDLANREFIPIIDLEATTFLRMLLRLVQPKRILEIGTAIGYSAILMANAMPNAQIITIERDSNRVQQAHEWICKAGLQDRITIYEGDALLILQSISDQKQNKSPDELFDFIFLDAAKGQYLKFLEYVLPLLSEQGTLLSDNVLFQGYVIQEGQVKHKLRTMINRMREYNQILAHHPILETTFVPLGDGMAISMRKK